MCTCMYTCSITYIYIYIIIAHTYTCPHTHTFLHAHLFTISGISGKHLVPRDTRTHTHAHTHVCSHTRMRTHTHALTLASTLPLYCPSSQSLGSQGCISLLVVLHFSDAGAELNGTLMKKATADQSKVVSGQA